MEIWQDILDGSLLDGTSNILDRGGGGGHDGDGDDDGPTTTPPMPKFLTSVDMCQSSSGVGHHSSMIENFSSGADDMTLIDDVTLECCDADFASSTDMSSSRMMDDHDVVDLDRLVQTVAEKHYSGACEGMMNSYVDHRELNSSPVMMETDFSFSRAMEMDETLLLSSSSPSSTSSSSSLSSSAGLAGAGAMFPHVVYKHGQVSPPSSPENDDRLFKQQSNNTLQLPLAPLPSLTQRQQQAAADQSSLNSQPWQSCWSVDQKIAPVVPSIPNLNPIAIPAIAIDTSDGPLPHHR